MNLSWLWPIARRILRHPSLWGVALAQAWSLAAPGWWRRRPFLPIPDPGYLRFRLETQYGGEPTSEDPPDPDDVVRYLRWCRTFGR